MATYKRNGKWEIRLQIKGKKYYRQIPEAANKAQAQIAEAALKLEIFEGRYGKEKGTTDFVKFCRDVYLPQLKSHAKTHKNLAYRVEILCRYFKGKQLKDLTQIAIAGYKRNRLAGDSRLGRPRKPITVKQEINTLSAILNLAIDNDLLGSNPCRKVKFEKGSLVSKRSRILEDEEEEILMPILTSEVRSAVVIALQTGLRRNEIIKRHVDDLDAQKRLLRVNRKGGKTQVVPLNSIAFAEFQKLASRAGADGQLFHIKPSTLTVNSGTFKKALRQAGIRNFTFHDLRRTFATRMKRLTDPFTSRDLMGHSKVEMTGVYTESSLADMRAAVELLAGRNRTVLHRDFTGTAGK